MLTTDVEVQIQSRQPNDFLHLLSLLPPSCLPLNFGQNSYLVELFHCVHLQLIKDLEVIVLHQLVSVDPAALVQVDFQQVRRGFQTLVGTEENALGRDGGEQNLRVSFQRLIWPIYTTTRRDIQLSHSG